MRKFGFVFAMLLVPVVAMADVATNFAGFVTEIQTQTTAAVAGGWQAAIVGAGILGVLIMLGLAIKALRRVAGR